MSGPPGPRQTGQRYPLRPARRAGRDPAGVILLLLPLPPALPRSHTAPSRGISAPCGNLSLSPSPGNLPHFSPVRSGPLPSTADAVLLLHAEQSPSPPQALPPGGKIASLSSSREIPPSPLGPRPPGSPFPPPIRPSPSESRAVGATRMATRSDIDSDGPRVQARPGRMVPVRMVSRRLSRSDSDRESDGAMDGDSDHGPPGAPALRLRFAARAAAAASGPARKPASEPAIARAGRLLRTAKVAGEPVGPLRPAGGPDPSALEAGRTFQSGPACCPRRCIRVAVAASRAHSIRRGRAACSRGRALRTSCGAMGK